MQALSSRNHDITTRSPQSRAAAAGPAGTCHMEGFARRDPFRQRDDSQRQRDRRVHRMERARVDSDVSPRELPARARSAKCRWRAAVLRSGKVLSAVYRLGTFQKSTGTPEGYGLRLLVEPRSIAQAFGEPVEATA